MGIVTAVVSGKGGTGKTSVCAGIAGCLAAEGQRVLCIDMDMGLRNLDISLGMRETAALPFTAVMRGEYAPLDAARHPQIENLFLLTAPVNEAPEELDAEAFGGMLQTLRTQYDWVLLDAPAGVGAGFRLAAQFADRVLVVSNGDPASLRDAGRVAELLFHDDGAEIRLVVNRVSPKLFRKMRATVDDVMDSVGLPLLAVIPEDENVMLAAAENTALALYSAKGASRACLHAARRLCGRKMPLLMF